MSKENLKKLLATKYQGNIYSEFSSLYCQASPYFYSNLTPPPVHLKGLNNELNLRDRNWICSTCGIEHNRDKNAAINIHRVGTSTLSLDNIRPSKKAIIA